MKPFYQLLTLLFCSLLWVASCKKSDPEPPKSADNTITGFAFNSLSPAVNASISGNTITATVPVGTNLTSLAPTITLPTGAVVTPASGAAQNFSNPVTYTVKAEDGTTQLYTVTVSIQGVSIVSFAPTSGGAGTSVVINGLGFSNISTENQVTVNGVNATITASRTDQITIQVPEKAGTGNIIVKVGGKQAASGSAFSYQYQIGTNTTMHSSTDIYQSTAVDPATGTVYASRRNVSGLAILRADGTKQFITLRDNTNANHASLTGITFLNTGQAGQYEKILLATNEAKGIFYYALNNITAATTVISPVQPLQLNDAIYNGLTSVAAVSQNPTAGSFMNGTYYMACFGNSTIVRSTRLNGVTQSPVIVGSPGSSGFNAGSVPTINARFNGVVGVFFKNDQLYVADEGNHAIRSIDYTAGTVNTVAGNGTAGNAVGTLAATRLNLPANVVVDNAGLIYVTDRGNGRLVVIDPRSQTSQTLLTGLNTPYGLSIDNAGTLYLGEWSSGTNRVLKLTIK
jgi:IPT/TIG domain/NHL repeat